MRDLLAKYGRIAPLRADEERALIGLATTRRSYSPGTALIVGELDEPDQLFIVDEGRLFASIDLPGGERAITRLYFPGDIIGTANIPFDKATHSITVCSDAALYLFPRGHLAEAFSSLPRIAAIFYTFAAMENAILHDRLVSIGRTRGVSRLAALILEIAARQSLLHEPAGDCFRLGLTQAEIGDAIGLTQVQVNRLFRELDKAGVIARSDGWISIVDKPALIEIGQFTDRYEHLDLSWFSEND
ncbi:Crp/Fnr family transcriptional regulator [Erythrobacter sp. SDW2]|uniref:Crp/Fnr family transcriptional regulator n=1 Tax=Erythrobacter sp. SDW2 TaxID=2907154 RepID=UPI001F35498C|nr:Crp/Fnr family transcriptional regulator [Erythrobacter sp. SDW2]UIP08229.1 Crp/Fnr family transcriptional regulator [Erythrobacter sp. SDW2]